VRSNYQIPDGFGLRHFSPSYISPDSNFL
jgi:hypothetical protein